MSYRAFKRLLGETSLERKCRFLLGAGILLLITLSFWVYARQTEHIAYEQTATTGRALTLASLARYHVKDESARDALGEFQVRSDSPGNDETTFNYKDKFIKPKARKAENKPDAEELAILNRFRSDPQKSEEYSTSPTQSRFKYYAAIRGNEMPRLPSAQHGRTGGDWQRPL